MLTTGELRVRLAQQSWTAHNIRLNHELTTLADQPEFLKTDTRLQAVRRTLSLVFHGRLEGLRVADLGCLEGGFSLALAQAGANVVALEAREANIAKARLLKEHFELDNLELVRCDVKEFDAGRFGQFDVVLALGILYHLDSPVSWLHQVSQATRRVLIVDSHFAPEDENLAKIDPRISALSPIESLEYAGERFEGRWFFEFDKSADPEPQLWASYSNHRSFWLTKQSLLLAMVRAGFAPVFEQHECAADKYRHFTVTFPRTMLVGVKP